MSISRKRTYVSKQREQAASVTRSRVLTAATTLFARRGIDAVTIAQIAKNARVSSSTIYALFKSKEGILEALMSGALFGDSYQKAVARLAGVSDPVELIAMTAGVARAIYESETAELGLIRRASAFSPALRKLEQIRVDTPREAGRALGPALRAIQSEKGARAGGGAAPALDVHQSQRLPHARPRQRLVARTIRTMASANARRGHRRRWAWSTRGECQTQSSR